MLKKTIPGKNGYDIPSLINVNGTEKRIVVVSHGFGGSKDNKTAGVFESLPAEYGLGTVCFDFPAHGDSPATIKQFSISNCVSDLAAVVDYVQKLAPKAEVVFFATSFGAYITLIYLAECEKPESKAFLRSAALKMLRLVKNVFLSDNPGPDADGIIELKVPVAGFVKVPKEFLQELESYDLFKLCRKGMAKITMLHGLEDNVSPIADAREFAAMTGAKLKEIPGAGHFDFPGGIAQAVKEAVEFYRAGMIKNLVVKELNDEEIVSAKDTVWNMFIENEASKCSIKAAIGLRRMIDKEYKDYGLKVYGAFEEGKLFGAALIRKDMSKLIMLQVDKAHLGCGVTRILFETILKNCTSDSISVNVPSFAEKLYLDLGFIPSADALMVDGIKLITMEYTARTKNLRA